jgi:hypothetical protein
MAILEQAGMKRPPTVVARRAAPARGMLETKPAPKRRTVRGPRAAPGPA